MPHIPVFWGNESPSCKSTQLQAPSSVFSPVHLECKYGKGVAPQAGFWASWFAIQSSWSFQEAINFEACVVLGFSLLTAKTDSTLQLLAC